MPDQHPAWTVVKVGGSLFDCPDLAPRLRAWLDRLDAGRVLLVPGGGQAADAIRALDRIHRLGEEASHWLALSAMSLNARFLMQILQGARLCESLADVVGERLYIIDPHPFFAADDEQPHHLPHRWEVTSDSLAVRAAVRANAHALILLKSVAWPGADWQEAANIGVVDAYFPQAVQQASPSLRIDMVNFRGPLAKAGSPRELGSGALCTGDYVTPAAE